MNQYFVEEESGMTELQKPIEVRTPLIKKQEANHETIKCPACGHMGDMTQVRFQNGLGTYFNCILLTVFLCPLSWIPFCFKKCKDRVLLCSKCGEAKAIIPYRSC